MSLSICYHKQISIICQVEIKISKCSRLNMSETEQNRGNNNSLQQSKNSSEEFLVLVSILYVQVTSEVCPKQKEKTKHAPNVENTLKIPS